MTMVLLMVIMDTKMNMMATIMLMIITVIVTIMMAVKVMKSNITNQKVEPETLIKKIKNKI